MTYSKKSYLEHAAYRVKDIDWHIRFFKDALGFTVAKVEGSSDHPTQVWMHGGLQLISDPDFNGPEGRMGHLGIMVEDLEAALQEVYGWGVKELPKGRNWLELPDGLMIELIPSKGQAVDKLLEIEVSYKED